MSMHTTLLMLHTLISPAAHRYLDLGRKRSANANEVVKQHIYDLLQVRPGSQALVPNVHLAVLPLGVV